MLNREKIATILEEYKKDFPKRWPDERFKWVAIKHFQDHWKIEAEDFWAMFENATKKTKADKSDLLASGFSYPKDMIRKFAKSDQETVRQMFRTLFTEELDLPYRINEFQKKAEELRVKYGNGTWKKHYQDTNAISTYLWLNFPDQYYIYKYELYKDTANELSFSYKPKKNGSVETMMEGFNFYDEIREVLVKDEELKAIFNSLRDDGCHEDPLFKTMTVDFGHYISTAYLPKKKEQWFPKEYSPNLTVEDWRTLLDDKSVFTDSSLEIMKRMKDYGGQASCKQLSAKYGESINFYNMGSSSLARRIAEKTNCPLFEGDKDSKWWPVLYVGKWADKNEDGSYIWKLRDELSQALDQFDLSQVKLYAEKNEGVKGKDIILKKYRKEDFLNEVYMDEKNYDELSALLKRKKNIILQGAPGVGKTFAAKKLAYSMMGVKDDSRIELVQFHQNYSYEDFVMGYRPNDKGGFDLIDGIFYRFCQKAANKQEQDYFFIIDEINRGNLSKIFGELLMLIEKDYRDSKATLAYKGLPFSVPSNLYIIGMMNTADRSLAMIDYALRRRFSFFDMEPGFATKGFKAYQSGLANKTFDKLIEQIGELNQKIIKDQSLGHGFQIGHSYFCGCNADECTMEWMKSIVNYDIVPMLKQYWFDNSDEWEKWKNALSGAINDER